MNEMQVFQSSDFGELGVLEIEGKPYFPATACAKMLGYGNARDAIKRHCKEEGVVKRDGVSQTTNQHGVTTCQTVEMKFINEGNLYRLIVHSKLPTAERFEKWVFDEVLPAIRKTGGYGRVDVTAIIMQTATAVCAEMVKQLAPLFQGMTRAPVPPASAEYMVLDDMPVKRPKLRKKPASIIDRLCPELRREVEKMLCDGRHTYSEICAWLRQEGISISTASVCRYAKRTGCYAAYEAESED